jgi:hypothetical protein
MWNLQEVPESDSDSSAQTERAKKEAEPQPSTSKETVPAPAPASAPAAAAAAVAVPAAAPAAAAADKWESSNSEHSGDEYHVYYYDPKALVSSSSTTAEDPDAVHAALFANCRRMEEPWEILFARAEALHAHGHSREVIAMMIFVSEMLTVD